MQREITKITPGRATADGAGVKLTRIFGGNQPRLFDPFLLLDEFGSDQASDYIAGFPEHPHRGFETVTYMLQGCIQHQDHLGNQGLLESGDIQWMTAGRGIIHSEMPQQQEGQLRGFQLWINLPKAEKMKPAAYRDIPSKQIPQYTHNGIHYKHIAGKFKLDEKLRQGAVVGLTSQALYLDLHFIETSQTQLTLPDNHTAMLYMYEGEANVGSKKQPLNKGELAQLSLQGTIAIHAEAGTKLLLLAGKPLNEPIVQHGPFVMNTAEEINQAIEDYRNGTLTKPASV